MYIENNMISLMILIQKRRLFLAVLLITAAAAIVPSFHSHNRHRQQPKMCSLISTNIKSIQQHSISGRRYRYRSTTSCLSSLSDDEIDAARQFKIVTCSASSCCKKRKQLLLDDYATFSAFWERLDDHNLLDIISIEETSCLGACQYSPCVAIEHSDYEGTVALDGMDPSEFINRVFHSVITDDDVDRVWNIVQNSIKMMAIEQYDDDEYGNDV